jgi:hypothetical protein
VRINGQVSSKRNDRFSRLCSVFLFNGNIIYMLESNSLDDHGCTSTCLNLCFQSFLDICSRGIAESQASTAFFVQRMSVRFTRIFRHTNGLFSMFTRYERTTICLLILLLMVFWVVSNLKL